MRYLCPDRSSTVLVVVVLYIFVSICGISFNRPIQYHITFEETDTKYELVTEHGPLLEVFETHYQEKGLNSGVVYIERFWIRGP